MRRKQRKLIASAHRPGTRLQTRPPPPCTGHIFPELSTAARRVDFGHALFLFVEKRKYCRFINDDFSHFFKISVDKHCILWYYNYATIFNHFEYLFNIVLPQKSHLVKMCAPF